MNQEAKNRWNYVICSLSVFPALFVITSLTMYFYTYSALGRFPQPSLDDPARFPINAFFGPVAMASLLVSGYLILVWPIVVSGYIFMKKRSTNWKVLGISSAVFACAIAVIVSPVAEWLID